MKIKTGGMDLLESETFLAVGDGETVITIREDLDLLSFILNFVKAEGEKKMTLDFEPVGKNTLKVNLTNWSSPFGITFTEPVEVEPTTSGGFSYWSTAVRPEGGTSER